MGRFITMLWGDFAFQFTRPEMRFVQILEVLRPIPLLTPMQQKGLAELSEVCFYYRGARAHVFLIDAMQVITMLWGHFALQFTRPEMRLVCTLRALPNTTIDPLCSKKGWKNCLQSDFITGALVPIFFIDGQSSHHVALGSFAVLVHTSSDALRAQQQKK